MLVTNGSLQAFHFVLEAFSGRGPRAGRAADLRPAAQDPGRGAGSSSARSRSTSDGLDVDELGARARRPPAAFLYTIPTFQNPTGSTLSERAPRSARGARARARAAGARGRPVRARALRGRAAAVALRARGRRARACYSSSFSKTIAPGLRVGYAIVPAALDAEARGRSSPRPTSRPRCSRRRPSTSSCAAGCSSRTSSACAGCSRPGATRCSTRSSGSSTAGARWNRPEGGYFLWLELPDEIDASELLRARARRA